MMLEQYAIIAALLAQTGALVWWASAIHSMVRYHDKQLVDHEVRLRKGSL